MSYVIEAKIKVTDEEVTDIFSSALVGCIFWADEAKVMGKISPEDEGLYTSDALVKGYKIRIHDMEADKWRTLTLRKFLRGLERNPKFDYQNYDSLNADCILQSALFGEQLYA